MWMTVGVLTLCMLVVFVVNMFVVVFQRLVSVLVLVPFSKV